jgi:hypothetical protein
VPKELTRIQQRQLLAQTDTVERVANEFRLRNPWAEQEELISVGTMAAIHAVLTWDPARGDLTRHVSMLARTAIGRHLAREVTGTRSGWGNGGTGKLKPALKFVPAGPNSSFARFHVIDMPDEVAELDDRLTAKAIWQQLSEEDQWWLRQHIEGWPLRTIARRAQCGMDHAQASIEVAIMRATCVGKK